MEKSLLQGDHLAPFLFFVVAEGLAGLFHQAVCKGRFVGFKFGNREDLEISML